MRWRWQRCLGGWATMQQSRGRERMVWYGTMTRETRDDWKATPRCECDQQGGGLGSSGFFGWLEGSSAGPSACGWCWCLWSTFCPLLLAHWRRGGVWWVGALQLGAARRSCRQLSSTNNGWRAGQTETGAREF